MNYREIQAIVLQIKIPGRIVNFQWFFYYKSHAVTLSSTCGSAAARWERFEFVYTYRRRHAHAGPMSEVHAFAAMRLNASYTSSTSYYVPFGRLYYQVFFVCCFWFFVSSLASRILFLSKEAWPLAPSLCFNSITNKFAVEFCLLRLSLWALEL